MADLTTFPIPTEVLDPADWPEFRGAAGPATEWQASATHLQARPVGGDTWTDVVALSEIKGPQGDVGGTPSISTVAITAGAIATPLDGNHRTLQLSEDVWAGWTAPLPSGADAATQVYWASLDILPPASGGPFALSIPSGWLCLSPLDTIALSAGDDPITVVLRSWGATWIAYSAAQSSLPA